MKSRIPDQAEKLRQLALQDTDSPPVETAVGILEQEEAPAAEESSVLAPAETLPTADAVSERLTEKEEEKPVVSAVIPAEKVVEAEPDAAEAKEEEPKEIKPFSVKQFNRDPDTNVLVAKPQVSEDAINQLLSAKRFPLEGQTQIISITGGKGGVGKSNIACNLGIAIARMKKRVLILDADLSLANIDVLLGLTPRHNLAHVLRGEKTLNEILITGPDGIQIIPGGSGLEELTNLTEEQMARLFEAFAGIDPVPDVLLIDTAAGIHPNVMQFLLAADRIIVVTTPEPTAYTDAYALIKALVRHDPERDIGVIINMARDHREAMEVTKLMFQMCRQFLNIMFNNLGYIPRDPEVLKAVRFQRPLMVTAPASPAAKEIRNIASTIVQIEKKNKRGLRGFFRRLFTSKQGEKK